MIGGSGHQRYPIIEAGVEKLTKRSLEAHPPHGKINLAGNEMDAKEVKEIRKGSHFLQTKNHDELSFILYNTQWVSHVLITDSLCD